MVKTYSYENAMAQYQELRNERSEWEAEWRQISDFLLPGRGIYQTYTKPQKRKLTTKRVINTVGEDSLYVLTSGMHGGLTSPSRPWFKLAWADENSNLQEQLKSWLQDAENRLHSALHASNFYSVVNSFYVEYAGFGTSSIYVGEDSMDTPFRFELLTAGEYVFAVGADGRPSVFYRTIFMTPAQLVEKFPKTASKKMKKDVAANKPEIHKNSVTIIECLYKRQYDDKPYTQVYYEVTGSDSGRRDTTGKQKPLSVSGFYEFPYPLARWMTIGSDTYGIGPGSRALPDIKRLQEMERSFLLATHKSINPPLNAPARMRGKLNTLPGGFNYYSNPNETVNEIYRVNFDYQGVGSAIERVEQRVQRNFFNDVFLTASRDPNASPLRTGQVNAQDQEKMLRLGPVIERLQHEFLQPLIERTFNIMLRKDLFLPLSPELAQMAGSYEITLVSPLATAQKLVALQGIQSFFGFVGQAVQFDQTVLDNVDADAATREFADITGVQLGVLRPQDQVTKLRQERAQAQAAEKQKQDQMQQAGMASQMNQQQAETRLTEAKANEAMVGSQETARDMGY